MIKYLVSQNYVSNKSTQTLYELVEVWLHKATPLGKSIVYGELVSTSYNFKP